MPPAFELDNIYRAADSTLWWLWLCHSLVRHRFEQLGEQGHYVS